MDLDALKSAVEREAMEGMINNFGQTPCQLLRDPHPQRLPLSESAARQLRPDLTQHLDKIRPFTIMEVRVGVIRACCSTGCLPTVIQADGCLPSALQAPVAVLTQFFRSVLVAADGGPRPRRLHLAAAIPASELPGARAARPGRHRHEVRGGGRALLGARRPPLAPRLHLRS